MTPPPPPPRQELSRELDYSQREFSGTALEMLKAVRGQMGAVMADGAALRPLLLCARLVCRIFFSLNALGLSETVEEQLKDWMGEFHGLLAIDTAVVDESDPDKESALDAVKARAPPAPLPAPFLVGHGFVWNGVCGCITCSEVPGNLFAGI